MRRYSDPISRPFPRAVNRSVQGNVMEGQDVSVRESRSGGSGLDAEPVSTGARAPFATARREGDAR